LLSMTDPSELIASVDPVPDGPEGAGRPSKPLSRRRRQANLAGVRIEVRWLPVEALEPDAGNARLHCEKQVARIADSIAAFGFNVPVLVDGEGGVLAGHGRLLAAKRLGLEEVPTIALGHLDEAGRRAFMIADNRTAELSAWDDARLALELKGLKSLALDFALPATGFEMSEIDLKIGAEDPPPRPAPTRAAGARAATGRVGRARRARLERLPVSRAGDVWALGQHRLVCGEDSDASAFRAIDAAISGWQAATGQDARLDPAGKTFASIRRERRRASRAKSEDAEVAG
jgi:ParB-like chromosome segregation protein Spo0J